MKQNNSNDKKKLKMTYRHRRKTLKGRLHKSLSLTSFISVSISLISILIILFMIIKPIGQYLTDSINNKIYKNYVMSSEIINDYQTKDNSLEQIAKLSFDDIIELSENSFTGFDESKLKEVHQELLDYDKSEIIVWGDIVEDVVISDSEIKTVLASTYLALQDIDSFISLGETIGVNWVNVRFLVNDEEIFKIPRSYDYENASYTEKKFSDIQSSIPIIDKRGIVVGELTTSLNTSVLTIVFVPIVILFIIVAGMTLLIVKILILPITTALLKPISVLNKELKKIAENESVECEDIKIEQKKPPTEIKQLIDYSNTIMDKLQSSHHILENQRDELETQNHELDVQKEELEAQNIELDAQKEELEAQNVELDAQKEELSAQNHELMTSQEKLRKAQGQLVQSEKLASMGQLTAAIMHEINTPLGAVQSNNQMNGMMLDKLSIKLEENDYDGAIKVIEKLRKSSKTTDDATKRVGEIIRNLKNFSRIDQAKFQNADITDGIKSVLVLTSNLWKNKLTIHESYETLPLISCYPSMLNQVFMNIIVNAIQASDKNDDVFIKTEFDDVYVYITIKDNGSGIKENNLEHIFDSGFTTKPKDEGTGLGLSISKDIIEKHCGHIEAFNNEDKGSTFKITLPIQQSVEVCKESGQ